MRRLTGRRTLNDLAQHELMAVQTCSKETEKEREREREREREKERKRERERERERERGALSLNVVLSAHARVPAEACKALQPCNIS